MLGRKSSIAVEPEQTAMNVIRSRLADHDNLGAASSILRRGTIGNHLEFSNGFQRWGQRQNSLIANVDIRYSINGHVGRSKPCAASYHWIDRGFLNPWRQDHESQNA